MLLAVLLLIPLSAFAGKPPTTDRLCRYGIQTGFVEDGSVIIGPIRDASECALHGVYYLVTVRQPDKHTRNFVAVWEHPFEIQTEADAFQANFLGSNPYPDMTISVSEINY
jgi:hypothetical protein